MHTWQRSYEIRLLRPDGGVELATATCEVRDWNEGGFRRRACAIRLVCGPCEVTGEGGDFFDAFCRGRETLAPRGLMPRCYGASRNVYPSGMARDMADGLQAYKLPAAGPVRMEHVVGIFEDGSDVQPASVAEQLEFWEAWMRSRRR